MHTERSLAAHRYSLFLAGERRKSEEALEETNSSGSNPTAAVGKSRACNQQLPQLQVRREL